MTTKILPFIFIPQQPIDIIPITLDDLGEREKKKRKQKEPIDEDERDFTKEKDVDPHSSLDPYLSNTKITYFYKNQNYTLYNYLTDGPIIYTLMRFVNEVEQITGYINQFDFMRFFIYFHHNPSYPFTSIPVTNEKDSLLFLDCFGQSSYIIAYTWKFINLQGQLSGKKCKSFHLFHLIQNRDSLNHFLSLMDIIDNRIKSEYATTYTSTSVIQKRETLILDRIKYFLSLTTFPPIDSVIKERILIPTQSQSQSEINFNIHHSLEYKYPSREEMLYDIHQQRFRFKRWISQASNLATHGIKQPLPYSSTRSMKTEGGIPSPLPLPLPPDLFPPSRSSSSSSSSSSSMVKSEPSAVPAHRAKPTSTVGPILLPQPSDGFRIEVGQAYQMLLSFLLEHSANKKIKTIYDMEKYLLTSKLLYQIHLCDYTALEANSTRLMRNRADTNTEMRNNFSRRWKWTSSIIIPLFFKKGKGKGGGGEEEEEEEEL